MSPFEGSPPGRGTWRVFFLVLSTLLCGVPRGWGEGAGDPSLASEREEGFAEGPSPFDLHESVAWAPTLPSGQQGPLSYLLTLDRNLSSLEQARRVESVGGRVLEIFPDFHILLVEAPRSGVELLAHLPGVRKVSPVEPLTFNLEETRRIVGVEEVRESEGLTGKGVTVAIVDSGVDSSHPALRDRVLKSLRIGPWGIEPGSGDSRGHGTHVAGIVAGTGEKSYQGRLRGIAPGASLVSLDISSSFDTANAVRAFEWIFRHHREYGIRIVTNSWGRENGSGIYDPDDPVIRASDALVSEGILVVFSAGNGGSRGDSSLTPEATNPRVLTVGAVGKDRRYESYSSRGAALDREGKSLPWVKPDVVAVGTGVFSTRSNPSGEGEEGNYVALSGTSMAAPQVAAVAALLLEKDPTLDPKEIQLLLQVGARDLGPTGADRWYGYGLLDAYGSLRALESFLTLRKVVVERRIPVEASGNATSLLGSHVGVGEIGEGSPSMVEIRIALPPNSTRLTLWFNWTGTGEFRGYLRSPAGDRFPFSMEGGSTLVFDGPIEKGGNWSALFEPTSPLVRASWRLEGWGVAEEVHDIPTLHLPPASTLGSWNSPPTLILSPWGEITPWTLLGALFTVVGVLLLSRGNKGVPPRNPG